MSEEWRAVIDFEGYEVSNLGRVRSVARYINFERGDPRTGRVLQGRRFFPGRLLRLFPKLNDYIAVSLGFGNQRAVHDLVLRAFVGEPRENQECLHWDNDRSNNKLSNLRWGTGADNQADSVRHGTRILGERIRTAKLTAEIVMQIRQSNEASKVLAARYGVWKETINAAKRRDTWAHVP